MLNIKPQISVLLLALLLCGATCNGRRQQSAADAVARNAAALAEKSKVATTGAHDAIRLAPVNPPTKLAGRLIERSETIQGLPVARLDVPGILASNKQAVAELTREMTTGLELIKHRPELGLAQEEANESLMEKGRLYEREKNRNIIKRVWRWAIGTFGIGGLIALMFFFPFLIPIFGKLVAWLVGMFPKIAGFVGVVGKKSFDSVVVGVQKVRDKVDKDKAGGISSEQAQAAMDSGEPIYTASQVKQLLSGALSTSTDRPDKALIETRKYALAEMIKAEPEPLIQHPESSDPPKPYRLPSARAPLGKPDTVAELLEQTEIVSTPAKKSSPKPSGADTVSELLETTEIKTP